MRVKPFELGRKINKKIPKETIILGYKNGIPVIKTFLKNNRAVFWCEYCKTYHYHGPMNGYRVAHCISENSPFHRTGYIIVIATEQ